MNVIANTTLLVRRVADLQRKREALLERQDRLRRTLSDWAFAPLQLVGMSADEIRGMMSDLSKAESNAGLDQVDGDIERIDRQIEELENMLLATPTRSFDGVQAVLDFAVTRFRAHVATDPNDVFYDYGDARVLAFLERATDDLRALLSQYERDVG
jgi:hypothetical protein